MKNHQLTDENIIQGIKDESTRERTLYLIFHDFGWKDEAITFVMQRGGQREDAEEIAIDALIGLDKNLRNDKFEGKSALKTYFLTIVKFQWFKRVSRRGNPNLELLENMAQEEDPVEFSDEKEKAAYEQALAQIGERCKQILELNILLEAHMKEIAAKVGLSSPEMAKKEAYRCRIRMREFLEKHPAWIERLKGLR